MGCNSQSNQKVDVTYIDQKGQLKTIPKKDFKTILRVF